VEFDDLKSLLANFDVGQLECLSGIAVRMATIKADSWTGNITVEMNVSQGVIADTFCSSRERIGGGVKKKRRVRSGGI